MENEIKEKEKQRNLKNNYEWRQEVNWIIIKREIMKERKLKNNEGMKKKAIDWKNEKEITKYI